MPPGGSELRGVPHQASGLSTVYNVGRYLDEIVRSGEGYTFASRLAVYDSEMIPNSIIHPI